LPKNCKIKLLNKASQTKHLNVDTLCFTHWMSVNVTSIKHKLD